MSIFHIDSDNISNFGLGDRVEIQDFAGIGHRIAKDFLHMREVGVIDKFRQLDLPLKTKGDASRPYKILHGGRG